MKKKIGIGVLSLLMVGGLVFAGTTICDGCCPMPGCKDGIEKAATKAAATSDKVTCEIGACCAK